MATPASLRMPLDTRQQRAVRLRTKASCRRSRDAWKACCAQLTLFWKFWGRCKKHPYTSASFLSQVSTSLKDGNVAASGLSLYRGRGSACASGLRIQHGAHARQARCCICKRSLTILRSRPQVSPLAGATALHCTRCVGAVSTFSEREACCSPMLHWPPAMPWHWLLGREWLLMSCTPMLIHVSLPF
jgi:hypothetical protein